MADDSSSTATSVLLGGDDHESTVEAESRPAVVWRQVARRWKNWLVVAVTAVTSWYLQGLEGWTLDAMAFAVITVVFLAYTLMTLYTDLE